MSGIQQVPPPVVINVGYHVTAGQKRERRRGTEWSPPVLPSSLEKGQEAAEQQPGPRGEGSVLGSWDRGAPFEGPGLKREHFTWQQKEVAASLCPQGTGICWVSESSDNGTGTFINQKNTDHGPETTRN